MRSTDEFYLMKRIPQGDQPIDTTNYRAIVTNCCLFVKIGTMSEPMYRDFSSRFEKEDIKYQYRKIVVKPETISPHSQQFITNNLFPDSENPLKLHFAIVQTSAYKGSFLLNPFSFCRRWTVKKSVTNDNVSVEVQNCYLRDEMAQMRAEMRLNMELFLEMSKQVAAAKVTVPNEPVLSTSKGKAPLRGRPRCKNRNLRPYPTQSSAAVNDELVEEATDTSSENSFLSTQSVPASTTQNVTAATDLLESRANLRPVLATEEVIYVKSFDLDLNSSPLDQVNDLRTIKSKSLFYISLHSLKF